MRLLIVLLLSLGITSEWGTSFSVRTPNDTEKELDYEFSIKLEDTNDKIRYLLKRDWERELGEKYIDDVAKFSHQVYDCFYYGVDYVNKESKDIFYTTYNIGITDKGFKAGLSVKDDVKLFSLGYNKKLKKDDIEYVVGLSFKSDLGENNIINLKSELKKWFTEKVNIFALYKHEYYNKQEDFQFKVGLGVKL
tara:strand:+ start:88 stop:666 length:579 start_codon:yes stop_codon:yes gene_type:complete